MNGQKSNAKSAIRKKKIIPRIGVLEFLVEPAVLVTSTGITARAIIIAILPFPPLPLVYQFLHSQPTAIIFINIQHQGMNILKKETKYIHMRLNLLRVDVSIV